MTNNNPTSICFRHESAMSRKTHDQKARDQNMANCALGFIIACILAVLATPAVAQKQNSFSVEVKPLPSLFSLVPGGFGISGEVEAPLTKNLSLFADATTMQLDLSDDAIEKLREDDDNERVLHRMSLSQFSLGGRYYGDTQADSWYAGVRGGLGFFDVAYEESNSTGARDGTDGEKVESSGVLSFARVEVGYRWLWESGFLMRLGVGATANKLIKQRATASVGNGDTKVASASNLDDPTKNTSWVATPSIDFGLGWAF